MTTTTLSAARMLRSRAPAGVRRAGDQDGGCARGLPARSSRARVR